MGKLQRVCENPRSFIPSQSKRLIHGFASHMDFGSVTESLSQGEKLSGSSTLLGNLNLQVGNPDNLTTRTEIVRWFGTSILNILYQAQMYTSSENN